MALAPHTYDLQARLPHVYCWASLVSDEAAFWFSLGISRALAAGADAATAFDAAINTLLTVTELGQREDGTVGWLQKVRNFQRSYTPIMPRCLPRHGTWRGRAIVCDGFLQRSELRPPAPVRRRSHAALLRRRV